MDPFKTVSKISIPTIIFGVLVMLLGWLITATSNPIFQLQLGEAALVFLPPYSPDLNPIEYIWKSIKRGLSPLLIESVEHFKGVIRDLFKRLSGRLSFASGWIKQFLTN